jgi:hypothetical protein
VAILNEKPYSEYNKEKREWEGFLIDIWEEIVKRNKNLYEYCFHETPDNKYGAFDTNTSTWNGKLQSKKS